MTLLEETLDFMPEGIKESNQIRTVGNAVYVLLHTGNKIKISLADLHTYHRWDSIKLDLINPAEGKVDTTIVEFKDVIGNYYIWDYRELEWYGPKPPMHQIEKIQDEIQSFYEVYESCANENV